MPTIEKVWRHCKRNDVFGKTVTLKVKYADFKQITRSRTVKNRVVAYDDLVRVSLDLLAGVFPVAKSIRLLGVSLSTLGEEQMPQTSSCPSRFPLLINAKQREERTVPDELMLPLLTDNDGSFAPILVTASRLEQLQKADILASQGSEQTGCIDVEA